MSLTTENTGTTMLVQPAAYGCGYGYGGNSGGGGLFGNNGDWLGILFLIALLNGGWGGFGGFGGGFGAAASGANDNYVLTSDFAQLSKQISDSYNMADRKFDAISNGICSLGYDQLNQMNGINQNISTNGYETRNAVQGLASQVASCCCDIREAVAGVNYNNAMTANAIQNQINGCCCDIREGIANVNYNNAMNTNTLNQAITNGFCQSNFNSSNNTRDILDNQNANTRAILEAINANKVEALKDRIAEQNQQITALNLAQSQAAQNAYLISELGPKCPTASYIVQPPQTVSFPTSGCGTFNSGCGCNG